MLDAPPADVTTAEDAARYPAGPSKGRHREGSFAPGVAKEDGHQGVPEGKQPVAAPPTRAADIAALHRVARRRRREETQRKERVDVRYSVEEKAAILTKARSMNIAAAHYVGALVLAHVQADLTLPGQRTQLDDYIDELAALRQQVTKIGHLVNQVTKKLNSGAHPHPGDTATLAHAARALDAVDAAVRTIAETADQAVSGTAAQ
nr:plasmid mobilization relaxosome protein MobC [Streptomyces sp. NRRL F-5126]